MPRRENPPCQRRGRRAYLSYFWIAWWRIDLMVRKWSVWATVLHWSEGSQIRTTITIYSIKSQSRDHWGYFMALHRGCYIVLFSSFFFFLATDSCFRGIFQDCQAIRLTIFPFFKVHLNILVQRRYNSGIDHVGCMSQFLTIRSASLRDRRLDWTQPLECAFPVLGKARDEMTRVTRTSGLRR